MAIEPILAQRLKRHITGAGNGAFALARLAQTLKRLGHTPLCAGVEEREFVAGREARPAVANADFPAGHVEDEAGTAAVVDVDEVAVEFDVQVARGLDRRVGDGRGRRVGDAGEEGAGRERHERDGAAGEGAGVVFYA